MVNQNEKKCPACGAGVPADVSTCPVCGLDGVNRRFLSKVGYEQWVKLVLEPHKLEWARCSRDIRAVALVKEDGLWFHVDQTGTPISGARYADARAFSDGLAAVQIDGKWGYIDKYGDLVIPARYDRIRPFSEGLAAVSEDGKEWGFIDREGTLVIPFQRRWYPSDVFREGLARVKQEGKYGFIDRAGNLAVAARWEEASHFSQGLAWVRGAAHRPWIRGCGCIDRNGEVVIPLKYGELGSDFSGGKSLVSDIWHFGIIDPQGNKVGNLKSRGWDLLQETRVLGERICVSKWKYAPLVTAGGEMVGMDANENYEGDETLFGFADHSGRLCVPCQWDAARDYNEGLAAVRNYNRWGFIDMAGQTVIPCRWAGCGSFSCGFAAVSPGCRWGFIDRNGDYVIEPRYQDAGSFVSVEG